MSGYHDGRNTFYIGEFDEEIEQNVIIPLTHAVRQQSEIKDGRLDLYINSYGGNAHILMHMVELVEIAKRSGVVVRTIVTSAAYSAGSMLAVAGTEGERYMAKNAMHLVHYGNTGIRSEETPVQTQRRYNADQMMFKQVLDHYNKYCDIPDLEDNIQDDNWYITAQQAKRYKMTDKFLDKFDLLW